ncbi:MAG: hypothetical protein ABEJ05_03655 [Haloglomus sp.]
MKLRHVTAALLALLVVGAGAAAAAPGAAPEKASADDQDASPSADAGPPSDLPGPVPDFVGEIHDTIRGFLNGSVDALGEAVSGVTPGGDEPSPAEHGGGSSGDGA